MNYRVARDGSPILDQFSEEGFVDCVAALADLYDISTAPPIRMVDHIAFTGIALHEDGDVDMTVEPIKIKLFAYDREDDPPDLYSESFFNLDLANGFVTGTRRIKSTAPR